MSNQMAVNVSGNFTEKLRQNNGLEKVGPYLHHHRLVRIPAVCYVEWHGHAESRTGDKTSVIVPAIEPGVSASGGDIVGLPVQDGYPTTAGGQIMWLLDMLRKQGGVGAVADTLFSVPSEDIHKDPDDEGGEMEGQLPLVPEVRIGSDGPHVVPPASGEELTAELDERRAATGPTRAEQEAAETKGPKVPAATFAAPDGGE